MFDWSDRANDVERAVVVDHYWSLFSVRPLARRQQFDRRQAAEVTRCPLICERRELLRLPTEQQDLLGRGAQPPIRRPSLQK